MRLSSIRDRLKACLDEGCVRCPMCKSNNTTETGIIHEKRECVLTKLIFCEDCGVQWVEKYTLSSMSMKGIEEVRNVHTGDRVHKAKSIQD